MLFKKSLLLVLLVALSTALVAVNHMDVMTMMEGSFNGSALGHSVVSLDFNGDGIKDLVALEKHWNPEGVFNLQTGQIGKINFYWGRTGFDNSISASIQGTYHVQYGLGRLFNAGDVNGDGFEDLGYYGSEENVGYRSRIDIFYGRPQPEPTPDRQYIFPFSEYSYGGIQRLSALGDINNDGFDDIGCTVELSNNRCSVRMIDGASNTTYQLYLTPFGASSSSICGIGDVNNDGIDDAQLTRFLDPFDNTQYRLNVLFGSSSFPEADSLVLCENTNCVIVPYGCPLGDVNGDGIDDFSSFINTNGPKVWYGGENLSSQWNVVLPPISYESDGYIIIHGDINNDGYEDLLTSNYAYGGLDGRAYIWMGGSNLNGTVDLVLYAPPGVAERFGWSKAAGDFNNDGFCDFAISQPWSQSGPTWSAGEVYVYAGNAQLEDTTVANDDPIAPALTEQLSIRITPNPFNPTTTISYTIPKDGNVKLCIYNLRGQLIKTLVNEAKKSGSYQITWNGDDLAGNRVSSGLYLTRIESNGKTLTNKMLMLK